MKGKKEGVGLDFRISTSRARAITLPRKCSRMISSRYSRLMVVLEAACSIHSGLKAVMEALD